MLEFLLQTSSTIIVTLGLYAMNCVVGFEVAVFAGIALILWEVKFGKNTPIEDIN